jgi:hypothetical protein
MRMAKMDMMDYYTEEEARSALDVALATKQEFFKEIENLNKVIFLLEYYLATGDALDPAAFGIEEPEDEEDEDDG